MTELEEVMCRLIYTALYEAESREDKPLSPLRRDCIAAGVANEIRDDLDRILNEVSMCIGSNTVKEFLEMNGSEDLLRGVTK